MSDSKSRHSGDWEGDLWSWDNHVELGQLCRIMRDVPFDEGLCDMLHVVLKRDKVSDSPRCFHISLGSSSVHLESRVKFEQYKCDLHSLKVFALYVSPSVVCQV